MSGDRLQFSCEFGAICCAMPLAVLPAAAQSVSSISVRPNFFNVTVDAEDLAPRTGLDAIIVAHVLIGSYGKPDVRFWATTTTIEPPKGPKFLIVTPARGVTTPALGVSGPAANGAAALDLDVVRSLAPGVYVSRFFYFAEGESRGGGAQVTLRVSTPPPPAVTAVVSAANSQPFVAPGTLVSIFGTNLGTPGFAVKQDVFGVYPSRLGNSVVTFDGIEAPLTYVTTTQINAFVPHEVAGRSSVRVIVKHHSLQSEEFVLPLGDTAPGIFTTSQDGNGPIAILRAIAGLDSPARAASDPVNKGGPIVVHATGAGLWNQDIPTGQILLIPDGFPQVLPKAPVSLTIGGRPAVIRYAGGAPRLAGVMQVDAVVPRDVESGEQVVELTVGENSSALHQRATVEIR